MGVGEALLVGGTPVVKEALQGEAIHQEEVRLILDMGRRRKRLQISVKGGVEEMPRSRDWVRRVRERVSG